MADWWLVAVTAVVSPIVVGEVKRVFGARAEKRRYRDAVRTELEVAGRKVFGRVKSRIERSLEAIVLYGGGRSEAAEWRWLEGCGAVLEGASSGFVVDECYLDASKVVLVLPENEARAVTVAIETWRRIRLHEVRYKEANEKFFAEYVRLVGASVQPGGEPVTIRELMERMRGELTRLLDLIGEYECSVRDVVSVFAGELWSIDRYEVEGMEHCEERGASVPPGPAAMVPRQSEAANERG